MLKYLIGGCVLLLVLTAGVMAWILVERQQRFDRSAFLTPTEARERLHTIAARSARSGSNNLPHALDIADQVKEAVNAADEAYMSDHPNADWESWPGSSVELFRFAEVPDDRLKTGRDFLRHLERGGLVAALRSLAEMDSFRCEWSNDGSLQDEFGERMETTIGATRQANKVLVALRREALDREDYDAWLDCISASFALSRAVAAHLYLIDRLSATSILVMSLDNLRHELLEHEIPLAVLEDAQSEIDRLPGFPPMRDVIDAEEIFAITDPMVESNQQLIEDSIGRYSTAEFVREVQRAMDDIREMLGDRAAIRLKLVSAPDEMELAMTAPSEEDLNPVDLLRDATLRTLIRDLTLESEIEGTRIMLAIERYRATHDAPPAALADLEPDYLDAIPDDALTGELFVYRLEPDHPGGYILYSIASDGNDDGGIDLGWDTPSPLLIDDRPSDFIFNGPRLPQRTDTSTLFPSGEFESEETG